MAEQLTALADVKIGDNICVWYGQGTSGQGGTLKTLGDDTITIDCPRGEVSWPLTDVHHLTVDRPLPAEDCLNHNEDCKGPVEMWTTGTSMAAWPRCTFHRDQRWASYENSLERFADSDVAPSDFDPADIGECWEDD
jgi:hypothetical protein